MKTLGDYLFLILSIMGSLASIIAFGEYFFPYLTDQGLAGVIFLGVIAMTFLVYNFWLVWTYRKKARYARLFTILNNGFSELHKIDRNSDVSSEDIKTHLRQLCNSISEGFSMINGHNVSTCIKLLSVEEGRPLVITLCRDTTSMTSRRTGSNDTIKHWLSENSDFNFIYKSLQADSNSDSHFFANFLPWKYDYHNTRLGDWKPIALPIIGPIFRQLQWPLPYFSTIVVPIVPIFADEQNQTALRGFLCIDSPKNISFIKKFDVDILKGIADGLYNKIDKLYDISKHEVSA